MFNSSVTFEYVYTQKRKLKAKSAIKELHYKFFVTKKLDCGNAFMIKYIVNISVYANELLRVDFYPKIKSDKKFMMLTEQFKFGVIGGTVFEIMKNAIYRTGCNTFGLLWAETLEESTQKKLKSGTKRFNVYKGILSLKMDPDKFEVRIDEENSLIFIIPNTRINQKNDIILNYGKIFKENF